MFFKSNADDTVMANNSEQATITSAQTGQQFYEEIVSFRDVSKSFGDNKANKDISFSIRQNEIHALLGENGAGKSTIMSILFGLYARDDGQIIVKNNVVNYRSAKDANADGIAMLPQHFKLIDNMTVLENVILGKETKFGPLLNNAASKKKLLAIMQEYDLQLSPDALVGKLSVSDKQRVEMLKILWVSAEIIVLDEPTSILTPREVENFLKLVVDFKKQGKTVILITHKLDEVKQVADRCTVLRRGKVVGTHNVADITESQMAKMMVGKAVDLRLSSIPRERTAMDRDVLRVENLSLKQHVTNKALHDLSFNLRSGEILGIAAVEGNGQSELFKVLGGMMKPDTGQVFMNGHRVTDWSIKKRYSTQRLPAEEIQSIKAQAAELRSLLKQAEAEEAATGELYTQKDDSRSAILRRQISHFNSLAKRKLGYLAHIPEDRHEHGLVLDFSCTENAVMQDVNNYSNFGFFLRRDAIAKLDYLVRNYDIRGIENANTPARTLSGGNQQKLILGREIERQASLLLAYAPTRGLDVGSIRRIYQQIIGQRNNGSAVLLYSGELDEIMDISDRIAIMHNGAFVGFFDARSISKEEVGLAMFTGAMPANITPRTPIRYAGEPDPFMAGAMSVDSMTFVSNAAFVEKEQLIRHDDEDEAKENEAVAPVVVQPEPVIPLPVVDESAVKNELLIVENQPLIRPKTVVVSRKPRAKSVPSVQKKKPKKTAMYVPVVKSAKRSTKKTSAPKIYVPAKKTKKVKLPRTSVSRKFAGSYLIVKEIPTRLVPSGKQKAGRVSRAEVVRVNKRAALRVLPVKNRKSKQVKKMKKKPVVKKTAKGKPAVKKNQVKKVRGR